MKKIFVLCSFLLLFVSAVDAQTIVHFKSGETVEGEFVEMKDDYIKLNRFGVDLTYWMDDINSIEFSDGRKVFPESKEAAGLRANTHRQADSAFDKEESIQNNLEEVEQGLPPINDRDENKSVRRYTPRDTANANALISMLAGGMLLFLVVAGLCFYIFSSICLQRIANRTFTKNSWFAWIPILNFILMLDIAEMSRWLAATILLAFIPIVNLIAYLILIVISVMIWMKIAEKLGKPSWLGILTILPVVQLVIMGYFAFYRETVVSLDDTKDNINIGEVKTTEDLNGQKDIPSASPIEKQENKNPYRET